MKRSRDDRLRHLPACCRCLAAGMLLACLMAAGCEDFDPFGIEPAEPESPTPSEPSVPSPPEAEPVVHPARPSEPPPPQYPMGLRLRDLHGWVFSPDRSAMFPEDERNTVIRDLEAGRAFRLTAEGEACAWSPDGQWILYWNRGWCAVNRTGKINRRVTTHGNPAETHPQRAGNLPIWHPAGPSLLVLDEADRFRLVAVTGERDRQVATTEQIPVRQRTTAPDFFAGPGGQWLFYVDRSHVGFLRSDGTAHRAGERVLRDCSAPQWSADGTAVLVLAEAPNSEGRMVHLAWRIDLPTGQVQPVCRADPIRRTSGEPVYAFAPQGFRVAYVAADRDQPRLVVVDARTLHLTKIHDEREVESLRFSPDGRRLAYVSDAQEDVVVLDLEAPKGVRVRCPALFERDNPVIEGWTADGSALVLWTANYTLWHVDVDKGSIRRLWPDTWSGFARRDEFETTHVPLEEENLVGPPGAFEAVPAAAADLEPGLQELPVQVVPEAPPEP